MTRTKLYPYPRFDADVTWAPLVASVEGRQVRLDDVADRWDAASTITLEVSAAVPLRVHRVLEGSGPRLAVTGSCKSTGVSVSSEAAFTVGSIRSSATAAVSLPGSDVAELIDVRASVIVPHADTAWLSRRIAADRPSERVSLDSTLSGFPTTSISFEANGWREAPWRISVSAVSLADPFAHSIQLILNENYPRVVDLIEGRAEPYVEASLLRSIIRALVHTARRLADEEPDGRALRSLVSDHPESIGAAAAKACSDYLHRDLPSVITTLRRTPEDVEMWIASATDAMKEKRK